MIAAKAEEEAEKMKPFSICVDNSGPGKSLQYVQWNAKIWTSLIGKMPKSKRMLVRILARSDFGSLGFNELEAQIEHSVCTIKTQMIENQTTFKWAFGFQ